MFSSTPNPAASADNIEMQRAMLRRLAVLGMRLAEEVIERAVNSPYHPEAVHEPGRAFAQVSRAVRLTIALQVKLDAGAVAPRNVGGEAEMSPRVRSGAAGARDDARDRDDDLDALDAAGETLRESEGESEAYDEMGGRSFDGCIAAIHVDLGLDGDGAAVVAAAAQASAVGMSVAPEPAPRVALQAWPAQPWPDPAGPPARRPSVTPPSTHHPTG